MMKKGIKLFPHQQRFADENPDQKLLVWETGTGKSIAGLLWLEKRLHLNPLVVCPKKLIGKWKDDLDDWGLNVAITTTDGVKKIDLSPHKAVLVDEAHEFASPLFTGKRSQRAKALYEHIKANRKMPVLLLTATPIRSSPWNIHTLACYLGIYWKISDYREEFFYFTDLFGRLHWEEKKGWQKAVRSYVEEIGDVALMSDVVPEGVPTQHHTVINIPWTKQQEKDLQEDLAEQDDVQEWHVRHRHENGDVKLEKLKEIIDGYRKVIVVCQYTKQIEHYAKEIGKSRLVFTLQGSTKDQPGTIKSAREADDCIFIVQASMGAGFDASEFSVVVFASMSFRYVDKVQMLGRVKRINNLHENFFIYLLNGKCDKAVYDTIESNRDFDVVDYLNTYGKN